MGFELGPRRAVYREITAGEEARTPILSPERQAHLEDYDLIYRSLCGILYNYVPTSGHPGGSISSGRIVASLLFGAMDYDLSQPEREDADIISYAAGHKAMGLYTMWALRNEIARLGAPQLLPRDESRQLRLEDLLGFRRNPVTKTPLFLKHRAKPLDGHPTPLTPFVRLATGASGVGVASSIGLALGARDYFGPQAPRVHLIEGEGGLTPGRVAEALAMAGTASLDNVILHLDWNQASIDTNRVCREGETPGDYVQWNPIELFYLHDWNVIYVPDGRDWLQIAAAQQLALAMDTGQPTAVIYRTVKGWQYGIEGRASHGAGHKLCSEGYYEALRPLLDDPSLVLPTCEPGNRRCDGPEGPQVMEGCLWEALTAIRSQVEARPAMFKDLASQLREAQERLAKRGRVPRSGAPNVAVVYETAAKSGAKVPADVALAPGQSTTLREQLGRVLLHYNRLSGGAFMVAAADLLGSTSINLVGSSFGEGYYHAHNNPESRILATGGICEDAMTGIMAGLSTFGHHLGAGSSYGAFIAALGHIAARLHAIGAQARREATGEPYSPMFLVCAHAGIKTGEDGPTHADPQPLQLLQDNFPAGTCITLTPWEAQELWPLIGAALAHRPAIIAPFVTRPPEMVLDRAALGLAPPAAATQGLYLLLGHGETAEGTLVLQGSEVAYAFVEEVMPRLEKEGIGLNVYYVASAELFNLLPVEEQRRIYPPEEARRAMGITGFTLPTITRWLTSDFGRRMSLHAFQKGHYLGSGVAHMVMREAGLDGTGQLAAIKRYLRERKRE